MWNRLAIVVAIVAAVGFVTNAFAQVQASDVRPLNRAGAVALLVEASPMLQARMQQRVFRTPPMPLFDDVDYTQWYASYVETAFEYGLITGNADRRFRPSDLLTQDEAVALVARFHALSVPGMGESLAQAPTLDALLAIARGNGVGSQFAVTSGKTATRGDFSVLMESVGISTASALTVTHAQQNVAVAAAPTAAPTPVAVAAPAQQTGYKPSQPSQATTPVRAPAPVQTPPVRQPTPVQTPPVRQPTPTPAPQPTNPSTLPISGRGFAISMPTLGIRDLAISHPSDPTSKNGLLAPLQRGVGHLFSYPGNGGTILIYGHSSSYPWDVSNYTKIFRQINKLSVGDRIYVSYDNEVHIYQVSHKQTVPAGDMSAYRGGRGEELILYTCWPPDSIEQRYLVHARPVEVVAAR